MNGIETNALTATQLASVQSDLGIKANADAITVNASAIAAETERAEGVEATKQDTLTFDTTPTADSANPCTSGGIKSAIDAKTEINDSASSTDSTYSSSKITSILSNYQKGSIGALTTYFADYADYTNPNDLINHLANGTESWVQTLNAIATTLYTNGVIPIASAGVIHVVNTAVGGRGLVELYADNGKHYHYETSNSKSSVGTWYVDTATAVS